MRKIVWKQMLYLFICIILFLSLLSLGFASHTFVPASWNEAGDPFNCAHDYYGDGDCDCGCGVIDSDCATPTSSCDFEYACTDNGLIVDPADNSQCIADGGGGSSGCGLTYSTPGETVVFGENRFCDSGEDGFIINANDVTIDCNGFTLGHNDASNSNTAFIVTGDNVKIQNCFVQDFDSGLEVSFASGLEVIGTDFIDVQYVGVFDSDNIFFTQTDFFGIDLFVDTASIFVLDNAQFFNTSANPSAQIDIHDSEYVVIRNSYFLSDTAYVVDFLRTIHSVFEHNVIRESGLEFFGDQNNTIRYNDFQGNWYGKILGTNRGIHAGALSELTVIGNNISRYRLGLDIGDSSDFNFDLLVDGNNVIDTGVPLEFNSNYFFGAFSNNYLCSAIPGFGSAGYLDMFESYHSGVSFSGNTCRNRESDLDENEHYYCENPCPFVQGVCGQVTGGAIVLSENLICDHEDNSGERAIHLQRNGSSLNCAGRTIMGVNSDGVNNVKWHGVEIESDSASLTNCNIQNFETSNKITVKSSPGVDSVAIVNNNNFLRTRRTEINGHGGPGELQNISVQYQSNRAVCGGGMSMYNERVTSGLFMGNTIFGGSIGTTDFASTARIDYTPLGSGITASNNVVCAVNQITSASGMGDIWFRAVDGPSPSYVSGVSNSCQDCDGFDVEFCGPPSADTTGSYSTHACSECGWAPGLFAIDCYDYLYGDVPDLFGSCGDGTVDIGEQCDGGTNCNGSCQFISTPPKCGGANGTYVFFEPTANFCLEGAASSVTETGTSYDWTCTNGTLSQSCVAYKEPICGSANGVGISSAPSGSALCQNGAHSGVSQIGQTFVWSCDANMKTASCSAPTSTAVFPAACGVADGTTTSTIPTAGLCGFGNTNTTVINGLSTFDWDCTNGTATVSCFANKDNLCGVADGVDTATQPSVTELCDAGSTNSAVTENTGSFTWDCSNGLYMNSCSADKPNLCGNGVLDFGESCEDLNDNPYDGCHECQHVCVAPVSLCGDGNLNESGPDGILATTIDNEECDDNNNDNGDGCSATCKIEPEYCGDGIVNRLEQCDLGAGGSWGLESEQSLSTQASFVAFVPPTLGGGDKWSDTCASTSHPDPAYWCMVNSTHYPDTASNCAVDTLKIHIFNDSITTINDRDENFVLNGIANVNVEVWQRNIQSLVQTRIALGQTNVWGDYTYDFAPNKTNFTYHFRIPSAQMAGNDLVSPNVGTDDRDSDAFDFGSYAFVPVQFDLTDTCEFNDDMRAGFNPNTFISDADFEVYLFNDVNRNGLNGITETGALLRGVSVSLYEEGVQIGTTQITANKAATVNTAWAEWQNLVTDTSKSYEMRISMSDPSLFVNAVNTTHPVVGGEVIIPVSAGGGSIDVGFVSAVCGDGYLDSTFSGYTEQCDLGGSNGNYFTGSTSGRSAATIGSLTPFVNPAACSADVNKHACTPGVCTNQVVVHESPRTGQTIKVLLFNDSDFDTNLDGGEGGYEDVGIILLKDNGTLSLAGALTQTSDGAPVGYAEGEVKWTGVSVEHGASYIARIITGDPEWVAYQPLNSTTHDPFDPLNIPITLNSCAQVTTDSFNRELVGLADIAVCGDTAIASGVETCDHGGNNDNPSSTDESYTAMSFVPGTTQSYFHCPQNDNVPPGNTACNYYSESAYTPCSNTVNMRIHVFNDSEFIAGADGVDGEINGINGVVVELVRYNTSTGDNISVTSLTTGFGAYVDWNGNVVFSFTPDRRPTVAYYAQIDMNQPALVGLASSPADVLGAEPQNEDSDGFDFLGVVYLPVTFNDAGGNYCQLAPGTVKQGFAATPIGCGDTFLDLDGVDNFFESGAGDDEQCDDGNTANGDGCNSACKLEYCGDGLVNNNTETCDFGTGRNDNTQRSQSQTQWDGTPLSVCSVDVQYTCTPTCQFGGTFVVSTPATNVDLVSHVFNDSNGNSNSDDNAGFSKGIDGMDVSLYEEVLGVRTLLGTEATTSSVIPVRISDSDFTVDVYTDRDYYFVIDTSSPNYQSFDVVPTGEAGDNEGHLVGNLIEAQIPINALCQQFNDPVEFGFVTDTSSCGNGIPEGSETCDWGTANHGKYSLDSVSYIPFETADVCQSGVDRHFCSATCQLTTDNVPTPCPTCDNGNFVVCTENASVYVTGQTYAEDNAFVRDFCKHDGTSWSWTGGFANLDSIESTPGVTEICVGGINSIDQNCNAHKSFARYPNGSVNYNLYDDGSTIFSVHQDVDAFDAACGVKLNGTVEDASGFPLEDVTVTLYLVSQGGVEQYYIEVDTDATGYYEFTTLPATNYTISPFKSGYNAESLNVNLNNYNAEYEYDFTLTAGFCRTDCTTVSNPTVCDASCDGLNLCSFYNETIAQRLDGILVDATYYDTDLNLTIYTCEGTPTPGDTTSSGVSGKGISCPEGTTLVINEKTVLYDGRPTKLRVAVCSE